VVAFASLGLFLIDRGDDYGELSFGHRDDCDSTVVDDHSHLTP
jgi:hypothetical protein